MPYIGDTEREDLVDILYAFEKYVDEEHIVHPGVFNYLITHMIDYMATGRIEGKCPTGYAFYNEIIGVLECAKLELYRRIVAPYEDKAIVKNGDVYYHTFCKTKPEQND